MDGLRATRRIKAARSAKVIKLPRPWLLLALALNVASPGPAARSRHRHVHGPRPHEHAPRPTHRHAAPRRARRRDWWDGRCGAVGVAGTLRPDQANILACAERAHRGAPRPHGDTPS